MPARVDIRGGGSTERARLALFVGVLLLSLWMVNAEQTGGDQYKLLKSGWHLLTTGELRPYGNPMSGGGVTPGALTSLLVGLPLLVWQDVRAVALLILLTHVAAYLLLDRLLREIVSSRERLIFAVLYWLNPWRLYFSAHLWNPNYLFLIGALHFWTAYRQRERATFLHSFLHVLILGMAFQIHGSFLILVLASVFLVAGRAMRVHVAGAAVAAVLVVASLIPWALLIVREPGMLPVRSGFLGRGLLYGYPLWRGAVYWLRYPSLHFGRVMVQFDFTSVLGARLDAWIAPPLHFLARYVAPLTVIVPLIANLWFWRRKWLRGWRRLPRGHRRRQWLHAYSRWCFVAALVTFSLSPTTITAWQALIVLHAAVLPVVLWLEVVLRASRPARWFAWGLRGWTTALVILGLGMALGGQVYRHGGRNGLHLSLSPADPLVEGLGLDRYAVLDGDAPGEESVDLRDPGGPDPEPGPQPGDRGQ